MADCIEWTGTGTAMRDPWMTMPGHTRGCPCLSCCWVNAVMRGEAEASVALDRGDVQTITLDGSDSQLLAEVDSQVADGGTP